MSYSSQYDAHYYPGLDCDREDDCIVAALHQKELEEQEAQQEIAQKLLREDPAFDRWLEYVNRQ